MANTINMLNTRTMLDMLDEKKAPKTFMLNTFFKSKKECETKYIDIDIRKGKERVAVYVNRNAQGNVVEKIGYSTYVYEPPYLKPKMVTIVDDILKRAPGEVLYSSGMTNESKAAQILAENLEELDNIIERREELQASEALFDNQISVLDSDGKSIQTTITFPRLSTHDIDLTATGNTAWDASGVNIFEYLMTWGRLIAQDSGLSADMLLFNYDVRQLILDNTYIQTYLDNRRYNLGNIEIMEKEFGVRYWGNVAGIQLVEYNAEYINPATGTSTPFVPLNKVLLASSRARCERAYGAIADIEMGVAAVSRFPKTWIENDPSVRLIQLHSAPLMIPVEVDAFVSAQVIA